MFYFPLPFNLLPLCVWMSTVFPLSLLEFFELLEYVDYCFNVFRQIREVFSHEFLEYLFCSYVSLVSTLCLVLPLCSLWCGPHSDIWKLFIGTWGKKELHISSHTHSYWSFCQAELGGWKGVGGLWLKCHRF